MLLLIKCASSLQMLLIFLALYVFLTWSYIFPCETPTRQVERLLSAEQKATDYKSPDDGIAPDHRPTNACTRYNQVLVTDILGLFEIAWMWTKTRDSANSMEYFLQCGISDILRPLISVLMLLSNQYDFPCCFWIQNNVFLFSWLELWRIFPVY